MTSNTLAKGRTLSNEVQKITITSNGDKRSECYQPTTGQMLSNKVQKIKMTSNKQNTIELISKDQDDNE